MSNYSCYFPPFFFVILQKSAIQILIIGDRIFPGLEFFRLQYKLPKWNSRINSGYQGRSEPTIKSFDAVFTVFRMTNDLPEHGIVIQRNFVVGFKSHIESNDRIIGESHSIDDTR